MAGPPVQPRAHSCFWAVRWLLRHLDREETQIPTFEDALPFGSSYMSPGTGGILYSEYSCSIPLSTPLLLIFFCLNGVLEAPFYSQPHVQGSHSDSYNVSAPHHPRLTQTCSRCMLLFPCLKIFLFVEGLGFSHPLRLRPHRSTLSGLSVGCRASDLSSCTHHHPHRLVFFRNQLGLHFAKSRLILHTMLIFTFR